jgi:hypothetical protein
VAQCPRKNDRWDKGPIAGCTNAIEDPKLARGIEQRKNEIKKGKEKNPVT